MNIRSLLGLCLLSLPAGAFAHGLIESPPSRNWICGAVTKPDQVDLGKAEYPACATAFAPNPIAAYNFMAVVTHTLGRAEVTPLPKNVCGFDGETWKGAATPWDVPMDWPTTSMSPGPRTFTWNVSWGPHFDDTFEFRYWITKADFVFSPAKALSWADFETEAFCIATYDDKKPTANPKVRTDKAKSLFMTDCDMPVRKGHHVIYGEWGRSSPTFERFHGCVDAAFGTAGIGPRKGGLPMSPAAAPDTRTDLLGRKGSLGTGFLLPAP